MTEVPEARELRAAVGRLSAGRMLPEQAADLLRAAELAVRKVRVDGNREHAVEVVLREQVTRGLLDAIVRLEREAADDGR